MARQIKNRREDLYINDVPPEILDETTLSADGFVKNTDYAGTDGGVIKVGNTYGTSTTGSGALVAVTRTNEQYASAGSNLFIGKGTLENIKFSLVLSVLNELANTAAPEAADGTVVSGLYGTKVDGEWVWSFGTITPPTP